MDDFHDLMNKFRASALPAQYYTYRGGPGQDWKAAPAEGPWTVTSGLVELQARSVLLPVARLADMNSLCRLHVHLVTLRSSPADVAPLFSHLEHLTLSSFAGFSATEWIKILSPSVLPALRSLVLGEKTGAIIDRGIAPAIASLGPQITSLAIIDESLGHNLERGLKPCMRSFTGLKHLVLLGRGEGGVPTRDLGRPDLYSLLPTTPLQSHEIISNLHKDDPITSLDCIDTLISLVASLRSNVPSLRSLTRIIIPRLRGSLPDAEKMLAADNRYKVLIELRSLALARRIALDETGRAQGRESAAWLPAWKDLQKGSKGWPYWSRRGFGASTSEIQGLIRG